MVRRSQNKYGPGGPPTGSEKDGEKTLIEWKVYIVTEIQKSEVLVVGKWDNSIAIAEIGERETEMFNCYDSEHSN